MIGFGDVVAGAAFFPAFWMALNQTLYGIRRAYHLSLRRATYVAIMVRISLRIHHIPKPTNLWFPASRREQTPSMLNKQPVFLTGAASSSVCRIDVSFRWNDYSNAYY
ncbi:hypothetical protein QK138_001006 [Yersinia enterocolitica]|nr:hypothetical protein [Yersinia enterocolitica]ELW8171008.1 hypothetical protein [Yersinia enterocolitica]